MSMAKQASWSDQWARAELDGDLRLAPDTNQAPQPPELPRRFKVIHIITGLNTGGAEVMLRELLRFADPAFDHEVISLSDIGAVGRSIQELGIPVTAMNMRANKVEGRDVVRLTRQIKRARPDVVQTWLYHADVIGGIAARLAGVHALSWGVHISSLDPRTTKKSTLLMVKLGALLSHVLPRVIVCCAKSTCELHIERGYAAKKMRVIFNGFDLERFKPDPDARKRMRRELSVPDEAPLIGLIGRFHPQKDHANFVLAAQLTISCLPDVQFLLCGEGCEENNPDLAQLLGKNGLRARFHLLGRRDDTPQVMAALDLLTLSSAYGEAFPMVVGEAMACGLPIAVTNVGDSAFLVDSCGRVVPPCDANALSRAWYELLYLSPTRRAHIGERGRARIQEHFAIEKISGQYHDLYRDMLCGNHKERRPQKMWKHAL